MILLKISVNAGYHFTEYQNKHSTFAPTGLVLKKKKKTGKIPSRLILSTWLYFSKKLLVPLICQFIMDKIPSGV